MIKELISNLSYREHSPFKENEFGYGFYCHFKLFSHPFYASIREHENGEIVSFIHDEDTGDVLYQDHPGTLTKESLEETIILWLNQEISTNNDTEDDYFCEEEINV